MAGTPEVFATAVLAAGVEVVPELFTFFAAPSWHAVNKTNVNTKLKINLFFIIIYKFCELQK
jgi:hypothetical protein